MLLLAHSPSVLAFPAESFAHFTTRFSLRGNGKNFLKGGGQAVASQGELLIRGGKVIDPAIGFQGIKDVLVQGGEIAAIDPAGSQPEEDRQEQTADRLCRTSDPKHPHDGGNPVGGKYHIRPSSLRAGRPFFLPGHVRSHCLAAGRAKRKIDGLRRIFTITPNDYYERQDRGRCEC